MIIAAVIMMVLKEKDSLLLIKNGLRCFVTQISNADFASLSYTSAYPRSLFPCLRHLSSSVPAYTLPPLSLASYPAEIAFFLHSSGVNLAVGVIPRFTPLRSPQPPSPQPFPPSPPVRLLANRLASWMYRAIKI